MNDKPLPITEYIRYRLTPLPFGTLLSLVAMSYMLEALYASVSNFNWRDMDKSEENQQIEKASLGGKALPSTHISPFRGGGGLSFSTGGV